MNKSGYVLAGFETLSSILDGFLNNVKGRFEDNFTRDEISNFLSETCSGFLHSYGQNFPNRKNYDIYNSNEASLLKKCRDTKLFDKSIS